MGGVVELRGEDRAAMNPAVFEALSQKDSIVVLRDVPEIRQLVRTLRVVSERLDGKERADEVAQALRVGRIPRVEALVSLHSAFRHLRDSRYVSCLFSDLAGSFGLPKPLLIDAGYCKMAVLQHWDEVEARRAEFGPGAFRSHPNEAAPMIGKTGWGNAHRDIDVSHYHFQINFWFPLHDVDSNQTLIFFPDAYRKGVPQYVKLADPDPASWGYGAPLQIPLKLGDTVVFHSQQVHASPSQAMDRNRFTVEVRVASACIDDNSRVYRRVFWKLENFQSPQGETAAARADDLAALETGTTVDHALAGRTAHAVFHRLFRKPAMSLEAGYVRREDAVLDDAIVLDAAAWARVIDRLEGLDAGEDLWLMVARLLLRQGQRDHAIRVLARIYSRTRSYFWAMEVGRVAGEAGHFDVAAAAFGVAEIRARTSDIALDRYTPGMPPPRVEGVVHQLLPRIALRAAAAFARRAHHEAAQATPSTPTFDHQFFWPPWIAGSFEHYDIFAAGGLLAALPTGRAFNPELCLEDNTTVVSDDPDVIGRILEGKLGPRLDPARPAMGSILTVGEYIARQILGGWYLIPRRLWETEPRVKQLADYNLLELPGVCLVDARGVHPKTASSLLPGLRAALAALAQPQPAS